MQETTRETHMSMMDDLYKQTMAGGELNTINEGNVEASCHELVDKHN